MIDLHTHSLFSDGALLPSELARRGEGKGYQAIAITDHIDFSNVDLVVPRLVKACVNINIKSKIQAIPGAEISYVNPSLISDLVAEARRLGAQLILVHGESIVEPVFPGTNKKALESEIDILAHPGLITYEEAELARDKSIFLEISARRGHSLANGHIARIAREVKANLILNTDAHGPEDLITLEEAKKIALGAGLTSEEVEKMFKNSQEVLKRCSRI
jgi:histidinol phosphatase-like PHP family hydrolase